MGTHSFSSHSTIYIMNFKLFLALFALSAALIMADETGGKKETDDGEQKQEDDASDDTDGGEKKDDGDNTDDDKKDDAKLKCWKSDDKGEKNKKDQECEAEQKLCQSVTKGKVTVNSCATTCAEATADQAVYCCGTDNCNTAGGIQAPTMFISPAAAAAIMMKLSF